MNEDQAKSRFIAINAIRLTGIAMFLVGLLIVAGKIELPAIAGYVLLAMGLVEILVMPVILARRWKTPPQ